MSCISHCQQHITMYFDPIVGNILIYFRIFLIVSRFIMQVFKFFGTKMIVLQDFANVKHWPNFTCHAKYAYFVHNFFGNEN